jgi:23S rRNA (guanosine2251-2'-O)-methyltransferase
MSEKNAIKKEAEKFTDSLIFEGMTSISAIINSPEQNDRHIVKVLYDVSKERSKYKELGFLRHKSRELGFSLEAVSGEEIDGLTIGSSHGGIIALTSERTIPSLSDAVDTLKSDGFYVMLEGIEDPYNFGYALRSLYAAGADGVILSPRNWMGAAGVVARASAGASEMLPMYVDMDSSCADIFKQMGYKVICAGIRNSVSIYEADMKKPVFLIIGGEKRGISASLLEKADSIVRIDYALGFKGSLSAASSAAIIGFEVMHQNKN